MSHANQTSYDSLFFFIEKNTQLKGKSELYVSLNGLLHSLVKTSYERTTHAPISQPTNVRKNHLTFVGWLMSDELNVLSPLSI